jgi:hypothetical protein
MALVELVGHYKKLEICHFNMDEVEIALRRGWEHVFLASKGQVSIDVIVCNFWTSIYVI